MTQQKKYIWAILIGLTCFVIPFQNCSKAPFESSQNATPSETSNESDSQLVSTMTASKAIPPTANTLSLTYTRPGPIPISKMKFQGCMFDGILSEKVIMAGHSQDIQMLARSNCFYLPRAVELWNTAPNFQMISTYLAKLRQLLLGSPKQFLFGAFIAESVQTNINYVDDNGEIYNPLQFCIPNTSGTFGANTCVPDLNNTYYQNYILSITGTLLDYGISDFMFGQIQRVDPSSKGAKSLFLRMRDLAKQRNKLIIIGGQTNFINDPVYLSDFDYILGGSYINKQGQITMNSDVGVGAQAVGQALLWSDKYRKSAKNVFIEFDWWSYDDDIHRYIKLSQSERMASLKSIRNQLATLNVGFLMPFRVPLNNGVPNSSDTTENLSCHGANQYVYSPNATATAAVTPDSPRPFSCRDEVQINQLLLAPVPPPLPPVQPSQLSFQRQGLVLFPNQKAETKNQFLLMQNDGNLVIYRKSDNAPLWDTKTWGRTCTATNNCYAIFQNDGNFVLYQGSVPYWSSSTADTGTKLIFQEANPYLSIYNSAGTIIWRSN